MLKYLKAFWKLMRKHATITEYGCPNPILLDGDVWVRTYINDYGWCYIKFKMEKIENDTK